MLEDLKPPVRTYACKVKTIAEGLDAKDREILLTAVNSDEWAYKTLSNELGKRGIDILDTTIARHRTARCACFRK
jgi:hypothetical protein